MCPKWLDDQIANNTHKKTGKVAWCFIPKTVVSPIKAGKHHVKSYLVLISGTTLPRAVSLLAVVTPSGSNSFDILPGVVLGTVLRRTGIVLVAVLVVIIGT